MSFYHWFSSHPNEIGLSGDSSKMQTIGKELRIAGANMENASKQNDFRRISSVPDIWSQHRLFEMLLLNQAQDVSYQEYEDIAQREWRAMLALLVMAESYGVRIKTETIVFPGAMDQRKDYPGSEYLFAAYSTRPNQELWPRMEIYYIEDGKTHLPIAMSSPTVHVIPTKDAWQNLRKVYARQIPWLTDNQVFAPVIYENGIAKPFMLGEKPEDQLPAMMPVHALMLQRWLTLYRLEIAARQRNKEDAALLQSVKLLSDYEDALAQAFRLNTQRMPSLANFFASEDHQEGLKLGNLSVPQNLKIFLDSAFYSVIDKNSTQSELLDTHRFAGGIAPECLISKSNDNGEYTHFFVPMPVTETFWQLWRDNEDLKPTYSIRCAFLTDGITIHKIMASVFIGGITFTRTYSIGYIYSDSWHNLCTAGIWPRQKIAGWSEYYLFCNEIGGYKLEPENRQAIVRETPYGKHEGIDGPLKYYRLSGAPDCCAMRYENRLIGYLKIRTRTEIENGDTDKILRASVDFGTSATTLYAGIKDASPKKVSGMYLWSLPLINSTNNVGAENSRLEKLFFPPLPVSRKGAKPGSNKTQQAEVSYQALLENASLASDFPACFPLQSLLADAKDGNAPRDILSDSWIYFRSFVAVRDAENWPTICSNLKWMRAGQVDQHRIRALLTELLIMLALEARCQRCGKLAITATYPLSFTDENRNAYYDTLNTILGSISQSTGIEIKGPTQADGKVAAAGQQAAPLVTSITESEAVFRYSVNQDSYNQNYFVVDIGGGSTDIFISLVDDQFHRNSMAASLGFGARKALIEALCAGQYFYLRELIKTSSAGLEAKIHDVNNYLNHFTDETRYSLIEDLFSIRVPRDASNHASELLPENFGEAFLKTCAMSPVNPTLEQLKNDNIVDFSTLKKRVAFYLGAIIWLCGLMLKGRANQNMNVSLLFAGNGSNMIRWLAPDMQRTRHFIHLLFQQASLLKLTSAQLSCRYSTMPKEEVAFGALLDVPNDYYAVNTTTSCQVLFGQAQPNGAFPAYQAMQYQQVSVATDFGTFAGYLSVFKEIAKSSFGWNFEDGEYDVSVLDHQGLLGQIDHEIQRQGFFLGALEVISGKYLQKFDKLMTEKGAR